MEWMVYEWYMVGPNPCVDVTEFDELDVARKFADMRADYHREYGREYDVRIYQLTNY